MYFLQQQWSDTGRPLRQIVGYKKGPTENQSSSPIGWLRMRVWRMGLRRTKSTIILWDGSYVLSSAFSPTSKTFHNTVLWKRLEHQCYLLEKRHVYCPTQNKENEPAHEIMILFILRKFILQTCMRSHPVVLDVWFLDGPFVYFQISCVRTTKALAFVISTIMSWAGSLIVLF